MARDHIVKMSLAYSFLIAMHIVITAIIFGLLIPYRGPQVNWPGVHRYLVFLVSVPSLLPPCPVRQILALLDKSTKLTLLRVPPLGSPASIT